MTQLNQDTRSLFSSHVCTVTFIAVIVLVFSSFISSPIYSIITLGLYLWILAALYDKNNLVLIVALPLLTLKLTEFVSFVYIENGAFMSESLRYGLPTAGSIRYFLISLFFIIGVHLGLGLNTRIFPLAETSMRPLSSLQVFILVLVLFFIGFIYINVVSSGIVQGFPLLINAERFGFWNNVSNPFSRVFINYQVGIAFLLCSAFLFSARLNIIPRIKYSVILLLVIHLILMLLFGFKQTAFALTITIILATFLAGETIKGCRIPLISFSSWLSFILFISVVVALLSYSGTTIDSRLIKLFDRISLQGQLWHLADYAVLSDPYARRISLIPEISEWASLSFRPAYEVGFDFGLYRVMQDIAAYELLLEYTNARIGFIFALTPSWLISYGFIVTSSLLVCAGLIWGLTFRLIVHAWNARIFIVLPPLGLALTLQCAAHIDGMSYRIFGLQIWILLGLAAFGLLLFTVPNRETSQ